MEPSLPDIIKTSTIIQYPSIRISRKKATEGEPELTVFKEQSEEAERIRLLQKIATGIPLQIIKNKSGVFSTALVHEVRNPLTNITLATELIEMDALNEEQKKFIQIIKRSVDRINTILSDFLTAQDKDEVHAEICSMNELLDEVLVLNNDRVQLKNISVLRSFAREDFEILVKKEEIKIALINIIVNALEAMPSENGVLKLRTSLLNEQCVIEIEDNGIGISEKNLANIFDPFYTNKPGGMGLGLSTTLDILLSNCGTLDVQSEEGSGTHFTLRFNKMERPGV
jgi:signal transduction histidine kinase